MKKKSLFSQKIKQARSKQSQTDDSFPKAISINLKNNQQQDPKLKHKEQIAQLPIIPRNQDSNQDQQTGFVDKLLMSQLKEEQVHKLQQQNDKSILQMSEQERQRYRELIMKQVPEKLLKKLSKNKKIFQSKQKQIKEQKKTQIVDQNSQDVQNKVEVQLLKETENKIDNQMKEQMLQEQANKQSSLYNILINIKTGEVTYRYVEQKDEQNQILSVRKLKTMVESQNNQTQIVASRIIALLSNFLFAKNYVKDNTFTQFPLTKISQEHFHLYKLAEDVYQHLIKSLIWQLKRTNFKSCWAEMISVFSNFVIVASKWLKVFGSQGKTLINLLKTSISEQIQRRNHFFGNQEQNCGAIYRELEFAKIQLNKEPIIEESMIDLIKVQPKECLNLLIVQQSLRSNWNTLLKLISLRSSQLNKNLKQKYVIQNSYPFILELQIRDKKTNQMRAQIKHCKDWIYKWYSQQVSTNFLKDQITKQNFSNAQEQETVFKYMHSVRILELRQFSQVLKGQSQQNKTISIINPILANQLILLNIEQYFLQSQIHDKSEIDDLSQMFNFVVNKLSQNKQNYLKKIVCFIIVDMFSIFCSSLPLSNHQAMRQQVHENQKITYQDLDQNLLNKTLGCLCLQVCRNGQHDQLWNIISEEKLKWLISCYNYSSFGNYCFTRLILFLAASCPFPSTKSMILEEVMSRYPFLFCHAAEQGVYGDQNLYRNGCEVPQMQQIYQTVIFNHKISQDNKFVQFLLRK